ncbi:MAG: LytTR family DNA-binding domain-containing protein [Lachnospiraceae bacterium]|nr:LytTR family DNA-binding domain-containing protein [Lachnospiraceae bacterium]
MKITVCDDEKRIRETIADCIKEVNANVEVETYSDAKLVVSPSFESDIVFLDIQMPGIDGMNAAKLLRSNGKKTVIVFVTALEDYVFNAFDVGAFQYIVKPFDKEKLKAVICQAIEQANEQKYIDKMLSDKESSEESRTILVKSGGANTKVIISDIEYAEIFDRRIVLHMTSRDTIEYYGKMSDLESILGKDFFRVHRAYMINLAFVKSYDSKTVNVAGKEIPVARGKYQELIKTYLSFHTRKEHL